MLSQYAPFPTHLASTWDVEHSLSRWLQLWQEAYGALAPWAGRGCSSITDSLPLASWEGLSLGVQGQVEG